MAKVFLPPPGTYEVSKCHHVSVYYKPDSIKPVCSQCHKPTNWLTYLKKDNPS